LKAFASLLRENPNYRYTWIGQVVSEVGDHFNNVAVFSLAIANTRSGLVVSGVMLARAVPGMLVGPLAGVVLDRFNRKRVMIASDLFRAAVALAFILTVNRHDTWLLYVLSALLMAASPFFSSGRNAILPTIATGGELDTANSLTQTTTWTTLTLGTMLGGASVAQFGYQWAFAGNALSFLISAACIARLSLTGLNRLAEGAGAHLWRDIREGWSYMSSVPLILDLMLVNIGWASGGGTMQILFSVFGEIVFNRGPAGLGLVNGFAGVGLLCGGTVGHLIGRRLSFNAYKRTIAICYLIHGGSYVLFSQSRNFGWALFFIAMSRAGLGVSSLLNMSQLLRLIPNQLRGRVFTTIDSVQWSVMLLSMSAGGLALEYLDARVVGTAAGILNGTTAIFWGWAHLTGRLPAPAQAPEMETAS
jgi:MFS family permease